MELYGWVFKAEMELYGWAFEAEVELQDVWRREWSPCAAVEHARAATTTRPLMGKFSIVAQGQWQPGQTFGVEPAAFRLLMCSVTDSEHIV